MGADIKPLMALMFIFLFCIPKIAISENLPLNDALFVGERNVEKLKKELELILSQKEFQLEHTSDQIFEIYFDTPELKYLQNDGFVRYQATQFLTKKKKKKKYHEVIQHVFNSTNDSFGVKHYNNVKSFEEKHALLVLVKRKEREAFIDKIKSSGVVYPMRFKQVFQVGKIVNNYYLSYKNKNFMTLKLYDIELNYLSKQNIKLSMVELTSNSSVIEQFDEDEVKSIQVFYKTLLNSISMQKITTDYEYKTFVMFLKKHNKYFDISFKYPEIVNFLYATAIGILGLIIVSFFLVKRKRI